MAEARYGLLMSNQTNEVELAAQARCALLGAIARAAEADRADAVQVFTEAFATLTSGASSGGQGVRDYHDASPWLHARLPTLEEALASQD